MERNSISYQFFGDSTKTLISIENLLRLLLLISFIISFLPFPISLRLRFSRVLFVSILCIVLIRTYRLHGRPRWSLNYWTTIFLDSLVCYLLPLIIFYPTQFKFIPILIVPFSLLFSLDPPPRGTRSPPGLLLALCTQSPDFCRVTPDETPHS